MGEQRPLRVAEVFVPGGRPTVTYVPRGELQLEDHLEAYLEERYKVLSVSGPTKTGKTVLLRSKTGDAVWLSGGTIETVDDFWNQLADLLDVFATVAKEEHLGSSDTQLSEHRGDIGYSGTGVGASAQDSTTSTRTFTKVSSRTGSTREAVRAFLHGNPDRIIIIDDFHYVDAKVQLSIVRSLKDLVFEGLRVIVAAVPHRAYDVVRVEKEMTGRVAQLEVGFWSADDLSEIGRRGFEALNLEVPDAIQQRLVQESFQSPHLMQEFCRELCKVNGITVASDVRLELREPNWAQFFARLAPGTSKTAFDLLARGPRQRSDRKPRVLQGGGVTDIYGAVLQAIATTGPLTELTYERLRGALREVLVDEVPQRHEVTRVLEEMSRIAREQLEGEPVVDYDSELATLYISDPYFAYWLRWGAS